VRRADGNDHTRLANLQPSGAMNYPNMRDFELLMGLLHQAFHFRKSHGRVSLVNQVESSTPFGPFTGVTIESYSRAALRQNYSTRNSADIYGMGCQFNEV
jgi:hypothetical protein